MNPIDYIADDARDGLAILAFKVQALQFDLNRDLQFISMKDQLIRGRTLVLGAAKAGLIGPDIRHGDQEANLIVLGGGVGGVSAALMACELGFSVKLIESGSSCFSILGMGSDRLFSATVYDWPHEHSGNHIFPYVEPLRDRETVAARRVSAAALRFPNVPKKGGELRKSFIEQLEKYQETYRNSLDVIYNHRIRGMDDISVNPASGKVRVDVHGDTGVKHLSSQIVIFALGFGLDKSDKQTLAARDFFSYGGLKDDIERALNGNRRIRILGAGDGGLQEALRFCLDDQWHDLFLCVDLLKEFVEEAGHGTYWAQMCGRIQSAEDQAVRAFMWGYTEDCVYEELDRAYQREMDGLTNLALASLRRWHGIVVRKCDFEVQLVDESQFSKKVYGLNRWLAGLLIRLSVQGDGLVSLTRRIPGNESEELEGGSVELRRIGFFGGEKQNQVGTANKEDLLRRLAFQGVPMNLDPMV